MYHGSGFCVKVLCPIFEEKKKITELESVMTTKNEIEQALNRISYIEAMLLDFDRKIDEIDSRLDKLSTKNKKQEGEDHDKKDRNRRSNAISK
jgi:predicted  nucleic acid-binding Zn-ribbon protein